MSGANLLPFINYKPQKDTWCEFASHLIALSIILKTKYNKDRVFNPTVLWEETDNTIAINTSFQNWFEIYKSKMGLEDVFINSTYSSGYKGNKTYLDIRNCIDNGFPVVIGVKDYNFNKEYKKLSYEDGGGTVGHYVVAVGYDKNHIIVDNPWGVEYSSFKVHKLDLKKMLGGIYFYK